MFRPTLLTSRQRMTSDEMNMKRQSTLNVSHERDLGAAGIGQQNARLARRGRGQDLFGDEIDRRAKNSDVSLGYSFQVVEEDFIHGTASQGPVHASLAVAHSKNAPGQSPLLDGQPDRA